MRPGDGHWELARRDPARALGSLPRGISYQGVDRRGVDVWRISVYVGRDERRRPVEQRVRVHGTLEQATRRRDELLLRLEEERKKLASGIYRKTMAELLDKYFAVWQRTPRKGYLPARVTAYHRNRLIEQVIKPAFGGRLPAQVLPGQIADWYDELMEHGYTTQVTVTEVVLAGRCPRCGHETELMAEGRRRTVRAACPVTGCDGEVLCRATGERRPRAKPKQHPPASAGTLRDIHAILRGAFRLGVQRGWLAMAENPMTFVERPTGQHVKRRPPSPEEVRSALAAAEDHRNPDLYPFIALAADIGCRLGEAMALRLSDLDVDACAVRIERSVSEPTKAFGGWHIKDTKTHTKRTIAVHQKTMRIVLAHVDRCRGIAAQAAVEPPEDPFLFPHFAGHQWVIAPDRPMLPTRMGRTVSGFFASLGIDATAKSLRAFMVTNWRKARVPDDVLRGRVGHDEATPVTDRHYHYREAVADRKETNLLVGPLLYGTDDDSEDPPPSDAPVISLDAVRARRRTG